MSLVQITVRQRDGSIIWQQSMDRDSPYFQDFRCNAEADLLPAGYSITIVPEEELQGTGISQTRWGGRRK